MGTCTTRSQRTKDEEKERDGDGTIRRVGRPRHGKSERSNDDYLTYQPSRRRFEQHDAVLPFDATRYCEAEFYSTLGIGRC